MLKMNIHSAVTLLFGNMKIWEAFPLKPKGFLLETGNFGALISRMFYVLIEFYFILWIKIGFEQRIELEIIQTFKKSILSQGKNDFILTKSAVLERYTSQERI